MEIKSRNTHNSPPHNHGNKAAQIAADSDNYQTATLRLTSTNSIAEINKNNTKVIEGLYIKPNPHQNLPNNNPPPLQKHHLPGDRCHTIKHSTKNKGTGTYSDSIDVFTSLVKLIDNNTNKDIYNLFDLVYRGETPPITRKFFSEYTSSVSTKTPTTSPNYDQSEYLPQSD